MRVLMISGDRTVLHPDSHVAERMVMYGRAAEKIAIIVSAEGAPVRLSENVTVYPTGTSGRLSRIRGIVERGKALTDAFDLITAQDPFEYGVAALRLGKILHVPVELQLHTDIGSPYFRKEWKNMLRMLFVAARLRRAARVRVVSLRVASAVEALGILHARITVLPMFIDVRRFLDIVRAPSQKEKIILMAGRLEKEKQYPTALRAFSHLLKKIPDARLHIAGEGRLHRELRAQARFFGVSHAVTFLGAVADLSSHYAHAHAFLHTSAYEGFGAAIAEAALAGVPLVSTDVGIAGTLLRDEAHGRVVSVGDVSALARALGETLAHPARSAERARAAQAEIATHLLSSDAYVAALKEAWERAAHAH
jgi:glycosyltransferase involved in cell wall biosynthesis